MLKQAFLIGLYYMALLISLAAVSALLPAQASGPRQHSDTTPLPTVVLKLVCAEWSQPGWRHPLTVLGRQPDGTLVLGYAAYCGEA